MCNNDNIVCVFFFLLNVFVFYVFVFIFDIHKKIGEVTKELEDDSLIIVHGVFMFIGWNICCTLGIMSSAFRNIFFKKFDISKWFLMHRICQCMVLIFAIIAFILAVLYMEDRKNKHFDVPHTIIGLLIMILAILQPINAAIRSHPPTTNELKSLKRLIWEYIHKGFGYITWLLSLANILIGIYLYDKETVIQHLYLIFMILIIVIYMMLLFFKFKQRNFETNVKDVNNETQNTNKVTTTSDYQEDDNVVR